ncbi:MAG: AgmX/PglI C-terminal domain-containing protein [Proteobacteria bacterium]|jgi:hypothetical protein|nr:AgmX/PglI C-terminal domain-containing protein [Pseudomonadota bacterium]
MVWWKMAACLVVLVGCAEDVVKPVEELILADPPASGTRDQEPSTPLLFEHNVEMGEADKERAEAMIEVGEADKEAAKETIKGYSGQLKYCYESRLKANAGLAGRVEVTWFVEDGSTRDVVIISNTTGDSELASCIEKKINRWKFPASVEGKITWPFVFRAKK